MKEKKCSKCGEIKPISEFYFRKDSNKYRTECKICCSIYYKQWCINNSEYCKIKSKKWKKENALKVNQMCKKYRDTHKEERYITLLNYKNNNIDKVRESKIKSYTKIRKTIKGNLDFRMGKALRTALKSIKNGRHWEDLLGYSIKDLKHHLEILFTKDMSWNKFINGEIHIDHIIPKSLWKYESPEDREFKQCWALCNLQPLWAKDNFSKGNRCI